MMNRFLIALDKSNNSLRTVKFVAENINHAAQLTLISILADLTATCELHGPQEVHPLLEEEIKEFCIIEEAKAAAMEGFLDEARKTLIKSGFPPNNITVYLRKQQTDIASDILTEARSGDYDVVIVGRRGLSAVKQFMFGSISNKVINHAGDLSIIVVD